MSLKLSAKEKELGQVTSCLTDIASSWVSEIQRGEEVRRGWDGWGRGATQSGGVSAGL